MRNIVVCSDGTGNQFGDHNTNVVRAFRNIPTSETQLAFYDPGLGTFDPKKTGTGSVTVFGKAGAELRKLKGKATGAGIQTNVQDAYEYLMTHHRPGDRVYLFGFSRGAHTVRVLAGMLHKVGLLEEGSKNLVPYAYRMARHGEDGIAWQFKEAFSRSCPVHFLGVWDTVRTVGFIKPHKFSNEILNPEVGHACHALAIDEQRGKFEPSLWDEDASVNPERIEQVWFAGVHSDVGGWYDDQGVSSIAFRWMLKQAEAHELELMPGWADGLPLDPQGPQHDSWSLLYKFTDFFRPVRRDIPDGARIHQSVKERLDSVVPVHDSDEQPKEPVTYNPSFPSSYVFVDDERNESSP